MLWLKFVISIFIFYALISVIFLGRFRRCKLSLKEIKMRLKLTNSIFICCVCLILPYVIREGFIFILHFVLNDLKAKIKLLFKGINYLLIFILSFISYFVCIPLTGIIKNIFKSRDYLTGKDVDFSNIFEMF